MDVWHYVTFRKSNHLDFFAYAIESGIVKQGDKSSDFVHFGISEGNPHWKNVEKYISEHHIVSRAETSYTEEELSNADFLRVWSCWRQGYPQPEEGLAYQSITYSNGSYCRECGRGLLQQSPFRVRKSPNWGNRHFMMLNWVQDELFMDDVAKNVLSDAGIEGADFQVILNKSGMTIIPNMWQWNIYNVLPSGVRFDNCSLDQIFFCRSCGECKYHPTGTGMLSFQKEVFQNAPDVMKTGEVFGSACAASRRIIVRQKVYRLIKESQLHRGLVFEPVKLV